MLVDTEARIFVPKHRRRVGYVFQDARLFPHLTVRQNLRYGRFFTPAAERYADFDRVVDLLGIATCSTGARTGFPAARSSASRSAGRCSRARGCC